jgi:hypothetical protein
VSLHELLTAAERHRRAGISTDQALILAAAEVALSPLDPHDPDDAAVILRAEQLLPDKGLRGAIEGARLELEASRGRYVSQRFSRAQPGRPLESADLALRDPRSPGCGS